MACGPIEDYNQDSLRGICEKKKRGLSDTHKES